MAQYGATTDRFQLIQKNINDPFIEWLSWNGGLFFFGFTGDDVTEAAPERQDLDAADAAARQRREQRRVGAAQVQPRLHAAPHRPVVGRVAPLHTNLRKKKYRR